MRDGLVVQGGATDVRGCETPGHADEEVGEDPLEDGGRGGGGGGGEGGVHDGVGRGVLVEGGGW